MSEYIGAKTVRTGWSMRSLLFLPGSVVADATHPVLDYYRRCVAERLPVEFRADIFIVDLEDSVSACGRSKAFDDVGTFLQQATNNSHAKLFLRVTGTRELRKREVELA